MKVIIPTNGDYFRNMQHFQRWGGRHAQAAKKAMEIEGRLRYGADVASQTTNHGESRIKGCVKFDLGNGFRLVTVQRGEAVVLLFIGDHDTTQRWMDENAGLEVLVRDQDFRVEFARPRQPEPWQTRSTQVPTITNVPFLVRVDGLNWTELIPSRAMRSILLKFDESGDGDELLELLEELKELKPQIAELCLVIIDHLQRGQQDAAQAAVDVFLCRAKPLSEEEPLTEEILQAEANQGRFVVLNDLTDAEMERLHDPLRFQEWMLFLHPGQRRVVEEDFSGTALLGGVSGSGKTCVLVHRARGMARKYRSEHVLVLTLNRSLARLIENLVNRLCLEGENARITVKPFHEYLAEVLEDQDLRRFLEEFGEYLGLQTEVASFLNDTPEEKWIDFFRAPSAAEQLEAFEEFLTEPGNPARLEYDRLEVFVFSQDQTLDLRRYLFEELELVRSAFLCYDAYAGYENYERKDRSIAFAGKRREAVLNILREWERWQVRRGRLDQMGLTQVALFALDASKEIPDRFRHRCVLVDEFQDFSTLELSILRRIPTDLANGLFLTGDVAQKVYAKDLNLRQADLGRDKRTDRTIRQNYRNSRQILLAANALLEKFSPPVGEGDDGVTVLNPEYARRETAKPIATKTADVVTAAWECAMEWVAGGHIAFSVCIATANPAALSVGQLLAAKPENLSADVLTGDYLLEPDHVVVSDIVSVKGFEFSLIIICGLDEGTYPPPGAPTAEHWREALRLYVAITRGRDEVRFLYRERPSSFLLAMADHVQFQTWEPVAPPHFEITEQRTSEAERVSDILPAPDAVNETQDKNLAANELDLSTDGRGDAPAEVIIPIAAEPESKSAGGISPHTIPNGDELFAGEDAGEPATPEILNGIPIVRVSQRSSQFDLARQLGKSQTEISLLCQELGCFVPPTTTLPRGIVRRVFERYGCVANVVGS